MAHDSYDVYEVTSPDGRQQLATANTLAEVRLAARTQCDEGTIACRYGPLGFDKPLGTAQIVRPGLVGERVVVRELQAGRWVTLPAK